jgi:hypothetical protein
MYYIGLDDHKKTISYCVKDASCRVHQEGKLWGNALRAGQLDEDSSAALDGCDGSNDITDISGNRELE